MIYTITDVKTACTRILNEVFPDVPIYGNDTYDGYKRPSFFTEIRLRGGERKLSRYQKSKGYSFIVTLFESTHDEAYCLDVYEQIKVAFGDSIIVVNKDDAKKKLVVEDIDYQWIDERADKLQVTIDFYNVSEIGGRVENDDIMKTLEINYKGNEV